MLASVSGHTEILEALGEETLASEGEKGTEGATGGAGTETQSVTGVKRGSLTY